MMQGFYMLALQRARRQRRIALAACTAALVCAFFAARAYFTPVSAMANLPDEPYVAMDEGGRLVVARGGETIIRTDIDTRALPEADRQALEYGVSLPDAEALAKLLEDYGS
ncbi:MAG: hypothetical protein Q4C72_03125 [Eubacteriales bacterium]|nr:hypothetical protein [Eubacteriales bacterium]